jgi:TIR domain
VDPIIASVFMSYAHADRPLAQALTKGLQSRGCRVWLDEGELRVGDSLINSISQALDQVDFVVVLVSASSVDSNWCRKEVSMAMTGEVNQRGITVLPIRVDSTQMPPSLTDKVYLDVSETDVDKAVDTLFRSIELHLAPRVPLPPRRRSVPARQLAARPAADLSPIRVIGIDEDHLGAPRNDGTRGSGLYAVPLLLSRTPTLGWSSLLSGNWDRPPSYTMMHRPGILRVSGSSVILDGTTIDEVERYHLETLKLAIGVTNRQVDELAELERARAKRDATETEQRRQQARNAAGRLNFD